MKQGVVEDKYARDLPSFDKSGLFMGFAHSGQARRDRVAFKDGSAIEVRTALGVPESRGNAQHLHQDAHTEQRDDESLCHGDLDVTHPPHHHLHDAADCTASSALSQTTLVVLMAELNRGKA
jgi:hypothetical protein